MNKPYHKPDAAPQSPFQGYVCRLGLAQCTHNKPKVTPLLLCEEVSGGAVVRGGAVPLEELSGYQTLSSTTQLTCRGRLVKKPGLATQFAPQASQAEQSAAEQRNSRAAIGNTSPSDDECEVLVR